MIVQKWKLPPIRCVAQAIVLLVIDNILIYFSCLILLPSVKDSWWKDVHTLKQFQNQRKWQQHELRWSIPRISL